MNIPNTNLNYSENINKGVNVSTNTNSNTEINAVSISQKYQQDLYQNMAISSVQDKEYMCQQVGVPTCCNGISDPTLKQKCINDWRRICQPSSNTTSNTTSNTSSNTTSNTSSNTSSRSFTNGAIARSITISPSESF